MAGVSRRTTTMATKTFQARRLRAGDVIWMRLYLRPRGPYARNGSSVRGRFLPLPVQRRAVLHAVLQELGPLRHGRHRIAPLGKQTPELGMMPAEAGTVLSRCARIPPRRRRASPISSSRILSSRSVSMRSSSSSPWSAGRREGYSPEPEWARMMKAEDPADDRALPADPSAGSGSHRRPDLRRSLVAGHRDPGEGARADEETRKNRPSRAGEGRPLLGSRAIGILQVAPQGDP